MAVARITLPKKSLEDLSRRAFDADRENLGRHLQRMALGGCMATLTAGEVRHMLGYPLLLDQAHALRRALTDVEAAEAYEVRRDAEVRPKLEARRRQLYALREKEEARSS